MPLESKWAQGERVSERDVNKAFSDGENAVLAVASESGKQKWALVHPMTTKPKSDGKPSGGLADGRSAAGAPFLSLPTPEEATVGGDPVPGLGTHVERPELSAVRDALTKWRVSRTSVAGAGADTNADASSAFVCSASRARAASARRFSPRPPRSTRPCAATSVGRRAVVERASPWAAGQAELLRASPSSCTRGSGRAIGALRPEPSAADAAPHRGSRRRCADGPPLVVLDNATDPTT